MEKVKRLIRISILVISCLIVMAGCGSKQNTEQTTEKPASVGRYVEYNITPKEMIVDTNNHLIDLLGVIPHTNGNLDLFAIKIPFEENAKCELLQFQSSDSGNTWSNTDTGWTTSLLEQFGDSAIANMKRITVDEAGRIYCILTTDEHTLRMAKIDAGAVSEILVSDWQSDEFYADLKIFVPQEFIVFPDGQFLVSFGRNAPYSYMYDAEGKQIHKAKANWYSMAFWKEGYASIDFNKEEQTNLLTFYDYAEQELSKALFPFDPEDGCIHWADSSHIFTVSRQGVAEFTKDSKDSKSIMDGSMYSFGMPSAKLLNFQYSEKNNEFFTAVSMSNEVKLFRYTFDPTMSTVSENNISIFSLNDSDTLRQAISVYQTKYPGATVNLQIGLPEGVAVTKNDVIRVLNTELQAQKGPDVIILNGLPVMDYINKGVLADLSDLASSEELFTNITQAYQVEDHVNAIPIRFQVPVLTGDRASVDEIKNIENLVSKAKQNPANTSLADDGMPLPLEKRPLARIENTADLCKLFIYNYQPAILQPDYTINKENLSQFLSLTKTIYEQCSLANQSYQPTIYDEVTSFRPEDAYGEKTLLGVALIRDFMDCFNWARSKPVENGAEFISPDLYMVPLCGPQMNVYTPSILAGVNVSTPHKDTAKLFMQVMLSEDVQTPAYSEGFPVNRKAFQTSLTKTKEKLDIRFATDMEQFTSSLTTSVVIDETLLEAILNETKPYYKNEQSLEEAVEHITSKLRTYLAEKS